MRSRVAFAGVALLILMALGALLGALLGSASRARFPSSFAGEPEGLMAFRRLLQELEVPTATLKRPWHKLDPATGVLVVATPLQRPVARRERQALADWIADGGALLVVDDATAVEATLLLDELLLEAGLDRAAPLPELDLQTFLPGRPGTTAADGTAARPSGTELDPITLHAGGGFRGRFRGLPLAVRGEGGTVAAEASLGAGRIVRVLGPLLANDRLTEGDNLELGLRLVHDLRGDGTVVFDEFHHGYGGVLAGYREIERSAIAWALVQAVVVTALYGFARGVRFGPPRLLPPRHRRSSLEFVHSMASLYRRGGHRRQMLGRMLERFRREARARWGLEEQLASPALARAVARRAGLPPEGVAETLERVELAAAGPRLGERELLELARELDRLEREVFVGAATAA